MSPRSARALAALVCVALLSSPPAWAAIALGTAAIGAILLWDIRAVIRRRRTAPQIEGFGAIVLGSDADGRHVLLSDR
jgi:hypothetical protein